MKKHTLEEHIEDVEVWWFQTHSSLSGGWERTRLMIMAYERWINDRELLTVENRANVPSSPA